MCNTQQDVLTGNFCIHSNWYGTCKISHHSTLVTVRTCKVTVFTSRHLHGCVRTGLSMRFLPARVCGVWVAGQAGYTASWRAAVTKITETGLNRCPTNQVYINDLVQACSNSSAYALELLQPCTKPWIGNLKLHIEQYCYPMDYFLKNTQKRYPIVHP